MSTPKLWEPGTLPTATQWREYFLSCTPQEQERLAEMVVHNAEDASLCVMQGHADLLDELRVAHEQTQRVLDCEERYRLAWLSARRRAKPVQALRNHLHERGMWP